METYGVTSVTDTTGASGKWIIQASTAGSYLIGTFNANKATNIFLNIEGGQGESETSVDVNICLADGAVTSANCYTRSVVTNDRITSVYYVVPDGYIRIFVALAANSSIFVTACVIGTGIEGRGQSTVQYPSGGVNIPITEYLPISNKTLPSLSNTNVTSTTIQEFCNSFNLKYGESTIPMYFESGTNYSNIQGLIQPSGVTYKQYNLLQVTRQAGLTYIITVYAGYNAQVQLTIPPQFFFVSSGGISPATSNYALQNGRYSALIAGGNTVVDTRSENKAPQNYARRTSVIEFKSVSSMGLENIFKSNQFVTIETIKGWDRNNYSVIQIAKYAGDTSGYDNGDLPIAYRYGHDETWGNWKTILATTPTSLKPWEDSTGWSYGSNPILTKKGLYLVAAAYAPTSSAPTYFVPTIMPFDGENGVAPIFDMDGLMDNGKIMANNEGMQVRSGITKVNTTLIYYQKIS